MKFNLWNTKERNPKVDLPQTMKHSYNGHTNTKEYKK